MSDETNQNKTIIYLFFRPVQVIETVESKGKHKHSLGIRSDNIFQVIFKFLFFPGKCSCFVKCLYFRIFAEYLLHARAFE